MTFISLTVKKVTTDVNGGTSFSSPITMGFQDNKIEELQAIGADSQFVYNGKTYLVDETYAVVAASLGVKAGGVAYVVGIIDMAIVGNRTTGVHDALDAAGNPVYLPKGATILDGAAIVKTTFTSATDAATISLGVPTDGAALLKAAIAISNGANPWDAGKTALIPVGTAATIQTPLTVDQKLQYTVAAEALTAGKMLVYVQYIIDPTAV